MGGVSSEETETPDGLLANIRDALKVWDACGMAPASRGEVTSCGLVLPYAIRRLDELLSAGASPPSAWVARPR
jgi:hypothetical protein